MDFAYLCEARQARLGLRVSAAVVSETREAALMALQGRLRKDDPCWQAAESCNWSASPMPGRLPDVVADINDDCPPDAMMWRPWGNMPLLKIWCTRSTVENRTKYLI